MATIDLTIKVTFISDWYIGLGAGQPGNLDSLVRRDLSGLPFVPGKTLTGMLRDGSETIALGLDGGKPGKWSACVDALFGDEPGRPGAKSDAAPLPARLSVRPAVFPRALADAVTQHAALKSALTFAKPGVAIDRITGAAKRRQFRMEEMVRGGCTLEAAASLNSAQIDADTELALRALLWAGAKLVRRIGGKRRRGVGRCMVAIGLATDQTTLLNRLRKKPPEEIARPDERDMRVERRSSSRIEQQAVAATSTGESTDRWFAVPISIQLKTPVVIPAGVLGNSVRTHDHIPGTQLLGAMSRAFTSLAGHDLQEVIACGDLQFANAYPSVAGERGLPLPFSIQHEKEQPGLDAPSLDGSKGHLINLAAEEPRLLFRGHRSGYVTGTDRNILPAFGETALTQVTHSTIDDEKQRPTTEVGGVFTYQALAASCTFISKIRCREMIWSALLQRDREWWKRLEGEYRIGIAKKDDYGQVKVAVIQSAAVLELEMQNTLSVLNRRFTVWLVSDLLLRDARLRPSADAEDVAVLLERRLKEAPGLTGLKLTLKPVRAFARLRRTDGWHVGWQLPRPSYVGLQAGSVLQFDLEQDVDSKALETAVQAIERSGLGERRAEGFGELRINHQLASSPYGNRTWRATVKDDGATRATEQPRPRPGPMDSFARHIEREAWRTQIARGASLWAIDCEQRQRAMGWTSKKPTNSQLGTLKSLVHSFMSATKDAPRQAEQIRAWSEKAVQSDKWPAAAGQRLSALVTDHDAVWKHFDSGAWPTIAPDRHDELRKDLWAEAVSALFFAGIQAERRHRETRQRASMPTEVAR